MEWKDQEDGTLGDKYMNKVADHPAREIAFFRSCANCFAKLFVRSQEELRKKQGAIDALIKKNSRMNKRLFVIIICLGAYFIFDIGYQVGHKNGMDETRQILYQAKVAYQGV